MGIDELRQEIIKLGKRPIAFFGKDWGFGCVRLFVALADDANSQIYLSSAIYDLKVYQKDLEKYLKIRLTKRYCDTFFSYN